MIVFSYIIIENIMLTWKNGNYNHINKVYMVLLMGALMGATNELIILINRPNLRNLVFMILWIIVSWAFVVLIRRQQFVSDDEFMKGMIEHHDAAILMSEQLINKSSNEELKEFAQGIIDTQQKEIEWMEKRVN